VGWAQTRFDASIGLDDLKNKQADQVRELLVDCSKRNQQAAGVAVDEARSQLESMAGSSNGALDSLTDWMQKELLADVSAESLESLDREDLERRVLNAVEDRFRPEIRRMERQLLLELVDTGWKDHLLVMDHLRSSVGLKGYAQLDPKVEYKREGMRLFEQMWKSIGERTTDLVFRMEQLDEGFVGSTWVETSARHDEAMSSSEMAQQQQEAIDGSGGETPAVTIRNRGSRVGRNEPCPCNSGKKYKNCCMRKGDAIV
jgi:preprotein translocase subunit SecA